MFQKFLGVILALGTSGGLAAMHRAHLRSAPWAAATAARPGAGLHVRFLAASLNAAPELAISSSKPFFCSGHGYAQQAHLPENPSLYVQ